MDVLAAIRPDSWNLPLFVHVLGAMALVGALATALAAQSLGWRRQDPIGALSFSRLGFRALLWVGVPSWLVMRVGAEWIFEESGYGDPAPGWVDVGYVTADLGGLLLLLGTIFSGVGTRRLRRDTGSSSRLVRASTLLVGVSLVAYVVAIWAMSAKP